MVGLANKVLQRTKADARAARSLWPSPLNTGTLARRRPNTRELTMSPPTYETVYDVLDVLRRRPGMFLGGKSMALLQAFLSGLAFSELRPGTPSFWDFGKWFTVHVRPASASFPWQDFEQRFGTERAVDLYFEYLDEFRRNTPRALAVAKPPFHPNFVQLDGDGQRLDPEAPVRLSIFELIPSNVIFLCEHYLHGRDRDTDAFRSVGDAYAHSESKWGIRPNTWTDAE